MSKTYMLTGAKTYATITRVFKAGEVYTEDQLGDAINAVTQDGRPMFSEYATPGSNPAKDTKTERTEKSDQGKRLVIGKSRHAPVGDTKDTSNPTTITI